MFFCFLIFLITGCGNYNVDILSPKAPAVLEEIDSFDSRMEEKDLSEKDIRKYCQDLIYILEFGIDEKEIEQCEGGEEINLIKNILWDYKLGSLSNMNVRRVLFKRMQEKRRGNIVHAFADMYVSRRKEIISLMNDIIFAGRLNEWEKGRALNFKDKQGNTPLHRAVIQLKDEVVEAIINWGGDFKVQNDRKRSPVDYLGVWNLINNKSEEEIKKVRNIEQSMKVKDIDVVEGLGICRAEGEKELFIRILEEKKDDLNDKEFKKVALEAVLGGWRDVFESMLRGREIKDKKYYASLAAYTGSNDLFKGLMGRAKRRTYMKNAVSGGNVELAKEILESMKPDPIFIYFLAIASRWGYEEIVMLFLDDGDRKIACRKGLAEGVSPIKAAAKGGHARIVKLLMDKNLMADQHRYHSSRQFDSLYHAASRGNTEVVKVFMEHNKKCGEEGISDDYSVSDAFVGAIKEGHEELVEYFIEERYRGFDMEERYFYGSFHDYDPYSQAVFSKQEDIACMLIKEGVVKLLDSQGYKIYFVSSEGFDRLLKLILKKKPECRIGRNEEGENYMDLAFKSANARVVKCLINKGFRLEDIFETTTIAALQLWNKEDLKWLMKTKVSGYVQKQGATELLKKLLQLNKLNWDNVELLIERGADINLKDRRGKNAFMLLLKHHTSVEALNLFISKGGDINVKDNRGRNLLMKAVQKPKNCKILKALIDLGLEVNSRDNKGNTPLLIASRIFFNTEVMDFLLDRGADVDAKDKNGVTSLMVASTMLSNSNSVKCLLKWGADVNAKDSQGKSPLIWASSTEFSNKISRIIDGMYCDDREEWKTADGTDLEQASTSAPVTVGILIDHGAKIDSRDNQGRNSIKLALQNRNAGIAELLAFRSGNLVMARLLKGKRDRQKVNKFIKAIIYTRLMFPII